MAGTRFAVASTGLAVAAAIFVIALGMGFGQRTERAVAVVVAEGTLGEERPGQQTHPRPDGATTEDRRSGSARGGFAGSLIAAAMLGTPIVITGLGAVIRSRRSAVVVRSFAAVVLLFSAFLFAFSAGPIYMVATGLMVAAVVLAATTRSHTE